MPGKSSDGVSDCRDRLIGLLRSAVVRLDDVAADRAEAIRRCGEALSEAGHTHRAYAVAMMDRDDASPWCPGPELAVIRGTQDGLRLIHRDALALIHFAEPVEWRSGRPVRVVLALAMTDDCPGLAAQLVSFLLQAERNGRPLADDLSAALSDDVIEVVSRLPDNPR